MILTADESGATRIYEKRRSLLTARYAKYAKGKGRSWELQMANLRVGEIDAISKSERNLRREEQWAA